jgi:outer membrane protein TolC
MIRVRPGFFARGILPSAVLLLTLASARAGLAQTSLATAVDLALTNSPKVKMAADDLRRSQSALAEAKDVFVPALNAGAGLGDSYGYTPNPPTLFTFSAQSLLYNSQQFDYIRSARSGVRAAELQLADAREAVAEDTAVTYASLLYDQQRVAVLSQQYTLSQRLVAIVQDRLNAGTDPKMDLTQAKLSAAQFHLNALKVQDDTANDQAHLALLIGLPGIPLQADPVFPALPPLQTTAGQGSAGMNPGVAAAFAQARAKQESAWGDKRFLYRPQLSLIIQYQRYASFTDSFKNIAQRLSDPNNPTTLSANAEVFGIQISIPLYDRGRTNHARETEDDAQHAFHDAQRLQMEAAEGQSKLRHSLEELQARIDVAHLEQELAQDQLDALLVQLNAPPAPNRPPVTPKDEQNSRIAEREKYLGVLESTFQLRQAQINLLRQQGGLESWIETSSAVKAGPSLSPWTPPRVP